MAENFGYPDGLNGLFVVVEREPLTPGCLTAEGIDTHIERLKAELDQVGARMKTALASRTVSGL